MTNRAPVPCNGCTACCRGGEFVVLFPEEGDDPASFEHIKVETECGPLLILPHKPNGDCIYLAEGGGGCTVYDRAPVVCQRFDCRKYFLTMGRTERRQMKRHAGGKVEIFEAARQRLATLTPLERAEAMRRRLIPRPEVSDRKRLRDTLIT